MRELRRACHALLVMCAAGAGGADPVRNGNTLALDYVSADAAGRRGLAQSSAGVIHTFRYLRITGAERDQPTPGAVRLQTVEPSSDALVTLVVRNKLSLDLARTLGTNDCVAANGRIAAIGDRTNGPPVQITVDPAVLRFKDRSAPKAGAEALNEVDRTAH